MDPDLANYIANKLVGLTRDVRAARGLGRACKTKEELDRHLLYENYELEHPVPATDQSPLDPVILFPERRKDINVSIPLL